MRFYIFFSGFMILAMGVAARYVLEKEDALGFLSGALQFGGGILF